MTQANFMLLSSLQVMKGMTPPLRPQVPVSACPARILELMEACWSEDPIARPIFTKIRSTITATVQKSGDNIVDHLINRMERYASELESQVTQKAGTNIICYDMNVNNTFCFWLKVDSKMRQFMEERQRSAQLLQVILPKYE